MAAKAGPIPLGGDPAGPERRHQSPSSRPITLDVLDRIAARLNMDYIRAEGTSGHSVALLSGGASFTASTMRRSAKLRRACWRCWFAARRRWNGPSASRIFIPARFEADEQHREKELAILLEIFRPHREAASPAHPGR